MMRWVANFDKECEDSCVGIINLDPFSKKISSDSHSIMIESNARETEVKYDKRDRISYEVKSKLSFSSSQSLYISDQAY